ncbi:cation:proton antiporter [Halorussus halophilus]|uniref:cation:proton antiporter n=1 Tax=Halorussus halophilus TaxID=2650975 RepID=UPI001CE3D1D1|nr:cation:proton antiporter [Halorussus halophilus]
MSLPISVVLGVVLFALALAGALADKLGQPVIPAYILAGIVLGPSAPSLVPGVVVTSEGFVHAFAELGLVALLFFLGVHVELDRLLSNYRLILVNGLLDFVVNVAVGVGIGLLFGFGLVETLFVAGMVYISSSAIVGKTLVERGWVLEAESEAIFGTLIFEDLVIALYIAVLSTVVVHDGSVVGALASVSKGIAFLAVVALVGWYGSSYVERLLDTADDEQFLLRVLAVATLVASAATFVGVSVGVTAFFVGATVGRTDLVERVEKRLDPVRDLFAAVFFFSIGLTTELSAVFDVAGLLAVAVVATTASKLLSGTLGGHLYGLDARGSLRVGVGMVARGEFSLVLAALARTAGTGRLGRIVPEFGVGYVLVMSVFGTLLLRHEGRLAALSGVAERGTGVGTLTRGEQSTRTPEPKRQ